MFSRVLVVRETLDDAISGASALRVPSSGSVGVNPATNQAFMTEIDPKLAEDWHHEADELVDRARWCHIVDDEQSMNSDDQRTAIILAPLELARRRSSMLWSDDPAIRNAARSEGIATFGTSALLMAMMEVGDLSKIEYDNSLSQLIRDRCVDLPLRPDLLLAVARSEAWSDDAASLALSRPVTWAKPDEALDFYRQCIRECYAANSSMLGSWSFAFSLGIGRSMIPHVRKSAIAAGVLSAFFQTQNDPAVLQDLVDGARGASTELELEDPLEAIVENLREFLLEAIGPEATPRTFTHMIGGLREHDRMMAFEKFLRVHKP
jgi:hypothetical protein